jgi:hypothetical protein
MDKTIRLLEGRGIVTDEAAERFAFESPINRLRNLAEGMRDVLYPESRKEANLYDRNPVDAFNFVANQSLRGETCCNWQCVRSKLEFLARYAALFADRVLVPFALPRPEHIEDSHWARDKIALRIRETLLLRPVIEAGIARLVLPEFHFCRRCANRAKAQVRMIEQEADALYRAHRKKFAASYTALEAPHAGVAGGALVRGPTEFLEHGCIAHVFHEAPAWAPNHRGAQPVPLTGAKLERSGLIKGVFERIAWDVVFCQFYGIRFDAKYLTDLPGETEFMDRVSKGDELVQNTAALAAQLTHSIPLFNCLSVPAILRIRREGHEAVVLYRAALAEIVREHLAKREVVSRRKAREIFFDILEPQLAKLKADAAARRRASLRKAIAKVGIPAALVCLGVWGGFLPSALSALFKAVGGVSLAANMAEALASIERNPSELRSHNLYFLLRLTQDAE